MMRYASLRAGLTALLASLPLSLTAAPLVVTDIPPVHALASAVMEGVGTPDLLLGRGAGAHSFSLRPSQARSLQEADLIFWVGPELTPWLDRPLTSLAEDARPLALLDLPGTEVWPMRETPDFVTGALLEDDDDHGHEGEKGHEARDPHAWLNPDNAVLWAEAMTGALVEADPENAPRYRENMERLRQSLGMLAKDMEAALSAVQDRPLLVGHDAWQYLERRFGLTVVGAIALGDASEPGPARLAALRDKLAAAGVGCVLTEPQLRAGLVDTVLGRSDVRLAEVDPAGSVLEPGAGLYDILMRDLTTRLADCLAAG